MPLIQWIMQNLSGTTTSITGSGGVIADGSAGLVTIYNIKPLGGVIADGDAIVVVSHISPASMVNFLGGLADAGFTSTYPNNFAF